MGYRTAETNFFRAFCGLWMMNKNDSKGGKHDNTSRTTQNLDTTWWGVGPIFREVEVNSIGGVCDIGDPASNQHDSKSSNHYPLLRWLSTMHNLIDLAKKAFPASESKNKSKKM